MAPTPSPAALSGDPGRKGSWLRRLVGPRFGGACDRPPPSGQGGYVGSGQTAALLRAAPLAGLAAATPERGPADGGVSTSKVKSLRVAIITQIVLIALPVGTMLVAQSVFDFYRGAQAKSAFAFYKRALDAKAHYDAFIDGVVDSVDTGRISARSQDAIGEAVVPLRGIVDQDMSETNSALVAKLEELHRLVHQHPDFRSIAPRQAEVYQLRVGLDQLVRHYQGENDRILYEASRSADIQGIAAALATLFSFMLTAYFVRKLIRELTRPLNIAVTAANQIALGAHHDQLALESGHDIDGLLESLSSMSKKLDEYRAELEEQQRNLERKVAERTAELSASELRVRLKEAQLAEALRIGNLAYWEYDIASDSFRLDDHFFAVARAGGEMPGQQIVAQEEFRRRYLNDSDTSQLEAVMKQALTSLWPGKYAEMECRLRCGDGDERWMALRFRVERGGDGRPLRLIGNIQDIDQRRKAESDLNLAASVVLNTTEGVVVTDVNARIISVNPAFTEITGYTALEAIGMKPSMLRSEHHGAEFYREMWATLLREGRWQGEIWNRRKNGEAYLEWLTVNMIAGIDGKPQSYIGVFHDITELRRKDEYIRHMAFHDALTGLPNRLLMADRLAHGISHAERGNRRMAVMLLDLDAFKGINDSLGHDIGDNLLQTAARRMVDCLRTSDTVARMGGDEFVVFLEEIEELEYCAAVAKKIIAALSEPMNVGGHAVQIGASIGIACYPDDGRDSGELLQHADAAMYAAKAAGRGTYRFFQPAMTEKASQRLKLEMELRRAVKNGELELFYQPKIHLADMSVFGVEALVRWRHPEAGLVSPADFIPVAEETGLIVDIGNWVLEEACRQCRAWRANGVGPIRIAVNVSAKQVHQGDLAERVERMAQKYGVSPACLEIELTESVVMADPEQVVSMFAHLRELGATVAIDDFGTGYSSLAYLRRLPIDVLKIDRSFVINADRVEADAEIVKTILSLGHSLNLKVVAEGVERESQAALLRAHGCNAVQGFLYARPEPAERIAEWLASWRLDQAPLPAAAPYALGAGTPNPAACQVGRDQ